MSIRSAGESVSKTRKDEDFLVRRATEGFPLIERITDYISCKQPLEMEYKTYGKDNNVKLSFKISNRTFSTCTSSGGSDCGISDTFIRTVGSGWGTSDAGFTWSSSIGSGVSANVDGSYGVLILDTSSSGSHELYANPSPMPATPHQFHFSGISMNKTSGTNDTSFTGRYWELRLVFDIYKLSFIVYNQDLAENRWFSYLDYNGWSSNVAWPASLEGDNEIDVLVECSDSIFRGKIWETGTSEPGSWTFTGTPDPFYIGANDTVSFQGAKNNPDVQITYKVDSLNILGICGPATSGGLTVVQSAMASVGTVPNQLNVYLPNPPEVCNVLVAFIYREVRPDQLPSIPVDGTTYPYTKYFWDYYPHEPGSYYTNRGDAGCFGMWGRWVERDETNHVLHMPYVNRVGVWVFELANVSIEGSGHQNYVLWSPDKTVHVDPISNPFGNDGIILGGAAISCVGWGQYIPVTTTVGTEIIDAASSGLTMDPPDWTTSIGHPPWCWAAYGSADSGLQGVVNDSTISYGNGYGSMACGAGALLLKACNTEGDGDMAYPEGVKIFIDGKDATYYLFGVREITPTDQLNTWRDIDITTYIRKTPGIHTIEIQPSTGSGRADVRLEIR